MTLTRTDSQNRCVHETHAKWPDLVLATMRHPDGSVLFWQVQEGLPGAQGLRYRVIFPGANFEEYVNAHE